MIYSWDTHTQSYFRLIEKFSRSFFSSLLKFCVLSCAKSQRAQSCLFASHLKVPRAEIPLIGVDFPKALKSLYQSVKERLRMNTLLFIADSAGMLHVNKLRRKWPKPWFTFSMYISHRSTHHLTYMSLYAERVLQLHQHGGHSAAFKRKGNCGWA